LANRVSAAALHELKESLSAIFWYKRDLRSFLQNCMSDRLLVAQANWDAYKRQIVSEIVDAMAENQDRHFDDLMRLLHDVSQIEDFSHLERLEDGKKKAAAARHAVTALRRVMRDHGDVVAETEKAKERAARQEEKLRADGDWRAKLRAARQRYYDLLSSQMPQRRGYKLETLLRDLFDLFDLDPKASFRNVGEQIDGGFALEGTDYLFEARWQDGPAAIQDLDAFAGKVRRKLENTLGLFLSVNGFSEDGVRAHSTGQPVLVLMTGSDLTAVLEERIDLAELLKRKRRHASQTGNILLPVEKILSTTT